MKQLFKLGLFVFLLTCFSITINVSAKGDLNYTSGTIISNTEVSESDISGLASLYSSTFTTYNGGVVSESKISDHLCYWVELNEAITSGYARIVQYNKGTTFNWSGAKPSMLARQYEIAYKGMMVIAGTNGDFFHIDTNCEPLGTAMQEGDFVKPYDNNTGGHVALGFRNDGTYVYGVPDVSSNEYVKIKDADGNYNSIAEIKAVDSTTLSETGVNLFSRFQFVTNKQSSNALASAKDIPFDLTDYKVVTITYTQERYDRQTKKVFVKGTVISVSDSQATYQVSDAQSTTILAAKDGSLDSINVGDSIKCECNLQGEWEGVTNIVSAYNQILKDGQVIDYDGSGNWDSGYVNTAKNRTIWGFKADGSPVMMVVEKNGSYGAHYEECAELLKALGCVQGFLFDGGGSADIFVRVGDNKFQAMNKQEDGGERSDANAILLVCKNPGYSITIKENGTTATFKLNITNETYFKEVKSVNIECNGQKANLVDGDLVVTGLKENSEISYQESYEITSFVDETKYVMVNKTAATFTTTEEKVFQAPTVKFSVKDITTNSFKIVMEENTQVISAKAIATDGTDSKEVDINNLTALFENLKANTEYNVKISFVCLNDIIEQNVTLETESVKAKTEAEATTPDEPTNPDDPTPDEPTDNKSGCKSNTIVSMIIMFTTLSTIFVFVKKH